MASLYILRLKLEKQEEMPLLSVRDARLLVIAVTFATQKEVDYSFGIKAGVRDKFYRIEIYFYIFMEIIILNVYLLFQLSREKDLMITQHNF